MEVKYVHLTGEENGAIVDMFIDIRELDDCDIRDFFKSTVTNIERQGTYELIHEDGGDILPPQFGG